MSRHSQFCAGDHPPRAPDRRDEDQADGQALSDLSEEGVTQVFRRMVGADWIVGVVGQLQLEVLASRVAGEYGVPITFESMGFEVARWIESDDPDELKRFIAAQKVNMAEDRSGAPVFLAQNAWWADRAKQDWPKIRFLTTKERH